MLLQFSIRNYRSFKEKATLSFIASNYDRETREDDNLYTDDQFGLRILKSAVVYGANASGKSKLLEALSFMQYFVISSSKESQKGDGIDVEPFRLSTEMEKSPSEFEIIFTHKKIMYRYGFEVDKESVVSEWLYSRPKTKEIELFYRERQIFETHSRNFSKGKAVIKEGLVRNNALLVSVAAQFNDKTSIEVIDWFNEELKVISGLSDSGYQGYTLHKVEDPDHKKEILSLLQAADLGIRDIQLQKIDIEDVPKDVRDKIAKEVKGEKGKLQFFSDILTVHRKYDINRNFVEEVNFSLDDEESSGTQKFFSLTGPILDVIENGRILCVDELDSKLHPNLVCKIISLFNSKRINKNNAQLIFNTHNTNLLSSNLFRRDQIWFTEKNKYGESRLYSLADFKSSKVKKNESFEDNYVDGKYGGVPYLGLFEELNKLL